MKRALPITSTLFVAGLGAYAAGWLTSKPNRIKAETFLRDWIRMINPSPFLKSENPPIKKGGNPDPHDIADNNMVSEGAQYSVQFYNEKIQ
jgi:hypothetical protein